MARAKYKVSVCIPVYNGADFITNSISSVLNQTYSDIELIVIDNDSSDNTCEIVEKKFTGVKLVRNKKNIGMAGNLNRCLKFASGEYVKILPVDDELHETCIQKQVDILENNPDIVLVSTTRKIINKYGKIIFKKGFSFKSGRFTGKDIFKKNVRSAGNLIGEPGSVLIRKSVIKDAGMFNSNLVYLVDIDFWFRALLYGNFYHIAEPLSSFRISDQSTSVKLFKQQETDYFEWLNEIMRNPNFKISKFDFIICKIMWKINKFLKKILYRMV